MDACTIIKSRLTSRPGTARASQASRSNYDLPRSSIFIDPEFFKKTSYVPDWRRPSRDVAKDIVEADIIPLLSKTLFDRSDLHGDCFTVTGRAIAETLKIVKPYSRQDVVRSADRPITFAGDVVGLEGNPGFAASRVRMPIRSANRKTPDENLTDVKSGARQSNAAVRATNLVSLRSSTTFCTEFWKFAGDVEPTVPGAVTEAGFAPEKQYYADI